MLKKKPADIIPDFAVVHLRLYVKDNKSATTLAQEREPSYSEAYSCKQLVPALNL